ncbi:MAG: glycosyltransferase family 39 protein [Anaerolineae bacterium]|nr:glycosyltransferase family 39 protein [Anaerolineae bacterium]
MVVLLLVFAGGFGAAILANVNAEEMSIGERVVLEAAIGFGAISLFTVIMGMAGVYNLLIWLGLLIAAILLRKHVRAWVKASLQLLKPPQTKSTSWDKFFWIFTTILLIFALLIALAPQTSWDALNCHLVVPKAYIREGKISAHFDNPYFGYPQNLDILFGLVMMFGTDRSPAVLHFLFGFLSLVAIYSIVRRFASKKSATVAVLVTISSYSFWILMSYVYVDLALVVYGAVSVSVLLQWMKKDQHQDFWLCILAALVGIAFGIKYTAGLIAIALYGIILFREPRKILRNTLILALVGFMVILPWLIKGFIFYGNPIYPYLFGAKNLSTYQVEMFNSVGLGIVEQNFIESGLWFHIPIQPFTATFFGINHREPYDFQTSVYLLTLPFLLLLKSVQVPEKAQPLLKVVGPMALIVYGLWVALTIFSGLGGRIRYILIAVPLASILCGLVIYAVEQWSEKHLNLMFMVQSLLVISCGLGFYNNIFHFTRTRALDYHTGIVDQDGFLEYNLGIHYKMMQALRDVPANSKVLFLWEPKTYYCPDTLICQGDYLFDNWSHPLRIGIDPAEVIRNWEKDYDFVLLYDSPQKDRELGYSLWVKSRAIDREENAIFPEYFFPVMEEVWTDGIAYTLYEFSSQP